MASVIKPPSHPSFPSEVEQPKMNKFVILALFAVSAVVALAEKDNQDAFLAFTRKYSKSYHHDQFQYRYRVFQRNLAYITKFNNENNGMTLAVNSFADLTHPEFQRYLGLKKTNFAAPKNVKEVDVSALPTSMDWVAKGAVTPIKNQGDCGSCWSFSTTGSVEGCHFLGTSKLVALSEQNLMDCSTSEGNEGCDGGLMTDAMNYIISNNGIDTEASYPYTAEDGTSCNYNSANKGSTLTAYTNVNQGSESDLQTKANMGPVSVAIDASEDSFQFYSTGVYYSTSCSSTALDHGVLVVGWGVEGNNTATPDYWLVKNSWGTDWGMNGFIWMARNMNNNCGIATMATLPTGCS